MLIAEATTVGALTAGAAWAGGGKAEDGGCEPASDDGGKSELVHGGVVFFLSSVVFEPWREVPVRTLHRPAS
jgi:hypothetical protein